MAVEESLPPLCVQVLVTQLEAKKQGFSDVLYLDAKTDTCVVATVLYFFTLSFVRFFLKCVRHNVVSCLTCVQAPQCCLFPCRYVASSTLWQLQSYEVKLPGSTYILLLFCNLPYMPCASFDGVRCGCCANFLSNVLDAPSPCLTQ